MYKRFKPHYFDTKDQTFILFSPYGQRCRTHCACYTAVNIQWELPQNKEETLLTRAVLCDANTMKLYLYQSTPKI